MIGGAVKFDNPTSFDFSTKSPSSKCYPKRIIKLFLDYVHLAALSDATLLDVLLLLDLLNSAGRQDSEYEQELAKSLCNDLIKKKFGLETKLVILHFMKSFDSQNTLVQYAAFVEPDLTPESLTACLIKFDDTSNLHTDVINFMLEGGIIENVSSTNSHSVSLALMLTGKQLMNDEESKVVAIREIMNKEDARKETTYELKITENVSKLANVMYGALHTMEVQKGLTKTRKLKYSGTTTIREIKQDMHHFTGASIDCQKWGKWAKKTTNDDMALWQLELDGVKIKQTFSADPYTLKLYTE